MIELIIGGGVGEHGRNCFYLNHDTNPFILDIGVLAGAAEPNPYLTKEQIKKAKWLFLSHSHKDHTGAYEWLKDQGFSGHVILTKECARQLAFEIEGCFWVDDFPVKSYISLDDGFGFKWGRTGHCLGSCWFQIFQGDKSIVYSGDYLEWTTTYECDLIRGLEADLAILDNAYGTAHKNSKENGESLLKYVRTLYSQNQNLILPVPKYGRCLEIITLLAEMLKEKKINIFVDEHFEQELLNLENVKFWLKPNVLETLSDLIFNNYKKIPSVGHHILFLSDPQLKSDKYRKIVEKLTKNEWSVLLTGKVEENSFSKKLLCKGFADFLRYSAHMNREEVERVIKGNDFKKIQLFHS